MHNQASFGGILTLGVVGSRQTPICVDRAVYPVDSIPMEVDIGLFASFEFVYTIRICSGRFLAHATSRFPQGDATREFPPLSPEPSEVFGIFNEEWVMFYS